MYLVVIMTRNSPTQVRLLPKEREAVQEKVNDGTYASVSDAIRMAVREKFLKEATA
jgi:Arc/MetJ-type ribon-helix-helix transcriptional regulator